MYVSASKDGTIKVWDSINNMCIRTIDPENAHSGQHVSSAEFSPSSKYILSNGKDGYTKLFDVGTGKNVLTYIRPTKQQLDPAHSHGHSHIHQPYYKQQHRREQQASSDNQAATNKRIQATFVENGDFVMCGDIYDNSINVWESRTGVFEKKLVGHTKHVKYISVSHTDDIFISCSEDARARFWIVTA
jgi:cleavage stimulation factor subunit 1